METSSRVTKKHKKELKTPKLEEPNPFRKVAPIFEILRKSSKKR